MSVFTLQPMTSISPVSRHYDRGKTGVKPNKTTRQLFLCVPGIQARCTTVDFTDMVLATSSESMHAGEVKCISAQRLVKNCLQYCVQWGRPKLAKSRTSWIDATLLSNCHEAMGLYSRWQDFRKKQTTEITFAQYPVRDVNYLEHGASPLKTCLSDEFCIAAKTLGL